MTRDVPADRWCRFVAGACLLAAATLGAAEPATVSTVGSDYLGAGFERQLAAVKSRNGRTAAVALKGTRPAIAAMRTGRADLALLLLPDGEAPPGDPYTVRLIGWHVTVLLAGPDNHRERVTAADLAPLGATGKPAAGRMVALAPSLSPAWSLIRKRIGEGRMPPVEFSMDRESCADRLAAEPGILAVADLGIVLPSGARVLPWAESSAAPAYPPDYAAVSSGRYPLRLLLWVAFRRSEATALHPWLDFLLSAEAAAAMEASGFLPLPVGERARLALEFEEMGR